LGDHRGLWQFEAYLEFCYAPKHTTGEQTLDVRRDKKERAAFAEAKGREALTDGQEENDDDEEEFEERYGIDMAAFNSIRPAKYTVDCGASGMREVFRIAFWPPRQ